MGIYIKGFEKKSCAECMFRGYERCLLTDEYLGVDAEYMPEKCPLIEVKTPHGRLIDARAFYDYVTNQVGGVDCGKILDKEITPTVIERED